MFLFVCLQGTSRLISFRGAVFAEKKPRFVKPSFAQKDVLTLEASDEEQERLKQIGAVVYEDVRFHPAMAPGPQAPAWADAAGGEHDILSLADVVEQINAPEAWKRTRGRGVTIAVVDTGVADGLREIDPGRRSPIDLETAFKGKHWIDPDGHGSMCAAIAGGSRDKGGRYDGVAPEATILAARCQFLSSEIVDIYDELLRARVEKRLEGPLVITNSYALKTCFAPGELPEDHPYFGSILAAIDAGVFVCFAAGNNHHDLQCGHNPSACGPNSIWGANSHDRVLSVGTVNRRLTNCDPRTPHVNSSRGPGEWSRSTSKPDCVAPTYGEVPWGTTYKRMEWWGSSGACPQAAGLGALLLSIAPNLPPAAVADLIRGSCAPLPDGKNCVGHGVIDCAAAIDAALAGGTA